MLSSPLSSYVVQAEQILETAEHESNPVLSYSSSLQSRLLQLHIQESFKDSSVFSNINPCSHLLNRLAESESFNRLILHLPSEEGYLLQIVTSNFTSKCFHFSSSSRSESREKNLFETNEFGSSPLLTSSDFLGDLEDDFMSYINAQELPPMLLDLLLQVPGDQIFYSGCIILEIKDSRSFSTSSSSSSLSSNYVLLKPSNQSIICDSHLITQVGSWSQEDKVVLESQLLLASRGPLCLDPSPVVSLVARHNVVAKQSFGTVSNRKKRRVSYSSESKLFDFLSKKMNRNPGESVNKLLGVSRSTSVSLTPSIPYLTPPSCTDVSKRARSIHRRSDANCDMTPSLVEEYILETAERGIQRIYHTRLTIYQRLANDEYLGELYVERDFKENDNKGSTCRFVLGTQPHALRYIHQFTEIFTEEGRKSVKITHRVPNQPPRVTYTPGMRERLHEKVTLEKKSTGAGSISNGGSEGASQEKIVISAIMQSLLQDSAAFEKGKNLPACSKSLVSTSDPISNSASKNSQVHQVSFKNNFQTSVSNSKGSLGCVKRSETPGLQALLANTPSADHVPGGMLLERLVAGGNTSDSTSDITLANLLGSKSSSQSSSVFKSSSTSRSTSFSPNRSETVCNNNNGGGGGSVLIFGNGDHMSSSSSSSASTTSTTNTFPSVQLSIPGLSSPVTLSVNVPDGSSSSLGNHKILPVKSCSSTLFISAASSSSSALTSSTRSPLVKTQSRRSTPLYLAMSSSGSSTSSTSLGLVNKVSSTGSPIQILRSQSGVRTPVLLKGSDSSLVAIKLQQPQIQQQQHHHQIQQQQTPMTSIDDSSILLTSPSSVSSLGSQIKIRQQRKQSLK